MRIIGQRPEGHAAGTHRQNCGAALAARRTQMSGISDERVSEPEAPFSAALKPVSNSLKKTLGLGGVSIRLRRLGAKDDQEDPANHRKEV
jgi:hypothetical protein